MDNSHSDMNSNLNTINLIKPHEYVIEFINSTKHSLLKPKKITANHLTRIKQIIICVHSSPGLNELRFQIITCNLLVN